MPDAAKEIYRSAELLVRARTGHASPLCVVTFDSFTDRRTLDRDGFGEAFLASRGINAVHVLSRDNDWYLLPDIEAALAAAARAAVRFERVTAYGSSMGGYAAIRLGRLAGASSAIALSPQFSIDRRVVRFEDRWAPDARRLDYAIERRLEAKGFAASATVFYDPGDRDARHVELYRGRLELREVRLADCGHPVTGFLAEVGLLQRAVLEAAAGVFDPAAFEREARRLPAPLRGGGAGARPTMRGGKKVRGGAAGRRRGVPPDRRRATGRRNCPSCRWGRRWDRVGRAACRPPRAGSARSPAGL